MTVLQTHINLLFPLKSRFKLGDNHRVDEAVVSHALLTQIAYALSACPLSASNFIEIEVYEVYYIFVSEHYLPKVIAPRRLC